jgi:hypothetical protein
VTELDPEDILVTIAHPFGDVEVSLSEWIKTGPGPRPLVRPVAARRRSTGESIPLSAIPIKYRNTSFTRALIKARVLQDPWKRQ